VPKSVAKRLKKGYIPTIRVTSTRQVFRVQEAPGLAVIWDSHIAMSTFGAKKEMLPFPFQVVQIVRYSSQGPSNAPGTLVGALSGLIPAPEGTFYSAAASMVRAPLVLATCARRAAYAFHPLGVASGQLKVGRRSDALRGHRLVRSLAVQHEGRASTADCHFVGRWIRRPYE
jgi:hypothetical protein